MCQSNIVAHATLCGSREVLHKVRDYYYSALAEGAGMLHAHVPNLDGFNNEWAKSDAVIPSKWSMRSCKFEIFC